MKDEIFNLNLKSTTQATKILGINIILSTFLQEKGLLQIQAKLLLV